MSTVFDEVVAKAGSIKSLQTALGERSLQAVCNWRTRGFPVNKCQRISALYGVPVQRLRPHDWRAYWPELAEAA